MELKILNGNLDAIYVIDTYESFIWTDRYYKYGDFELHSSMNLEILDRFKQDYYIQSRDSESVMMIEKLLISSDIENGSTVTITGRSLESILDRRIIWGQVSINGNLQNGIKTLLNSCIISPTDTNRKIPNFVFEETNDSKITGLTIDAQYIGDNLYDVVQKICEEKNIGFRVTLTDDKKFKFKLYSGVNRSFDQSDRPYVVFSPKFDNLIDSNYIESKMSLKNVTLVGGEGEGASRKYASVGNVIGIDRREMFTDAKDISSDVGNHKILTSTEYAAVLQQRGNETLSEKANLKSFEGKIETNIMFKYGSDFFIGDIVQITNEYGHEAKVQIIEVVASINESGSSIHPTYKNVI